MDNGQNLTSLQKKRIRERKKNEKRKEDRLHSATAGTGMLVQSNFDNEPKVSSKKKTAKVAAGSKKSTSEKAASSADVGYDRAIEDVGFENVTRDATPFQLQDAQVLPLGDRPSDDQFQSILSEVGQSIVDKRVRVLGGLMSEIEMAANFANNLHAQVSSSREAAARKLLTKEAWTKRFYKVEGAWSGSREPFFTAMVEFEAFSPTYCRNCSLVLETQAIRCRSCRKHLCFECDTKVHERDHPLHRRVWLKKVGESSKLKPTEFLNEEWEIVTKDVPVPCYVPSACSNCKGSGCLELIAGQRPACVVTQLGNFDLKSAAFRCRSCEEVTEATDEHYIIAEWVPGKPGGKAPTLFEGTFLQSTSELRHRVPGTSERKVLETCSEMSMQDGRRPFIDRLLFGKASIEYEFMKFRIDAEIKLQPVVSCLGCEPIPLAIHVDANFKVHRRLSAKGLETPRLFGNVMIRSKDDVDRHVAKIGVVAKPKIEACGGAEYKAGRLLSSRNESLDEKALSMGSCRHDVCYFALNHEKSESFREVHYLMCEAHKMGIPQFWYDVACGFKRFAANVGNQVPEFKPAADEMMFCLSRWHGKTHGMPCQQLHMGHMKTGACATSGEMQERVNAEISRCGNTTKHMSKSHRDDRLTLQLIKHNQLKGREIHNLIAQQLITAERKLPVLEKDLAKLLEKRGNTVDKLISTLECEIKLMEDQQLKLRSDIRAITQRTMGEDDERKLSKLEKVFSMTCRRLRRYQSERASLVMERRQNKEELLNSILVALQRDARKCERKRITDKTPLSIGLKSLEALHLEKELLKHNTSALAVGSKDRSKYRSKVTQVGLKAKKILDVVNKKLKRKITDKDFADGRFHFRSPHRVPLYDDQTLINTWMLTLRYAEEIEQSKKEFEQLIQAIGKRRSQLEATIAQADAIFEADPSSPDLPLARGRAFIARTEINRLNAMLLESLQLFRKCVSIDAAASSDEHDIDDADEEDDYRCDPSGEEPEESDVYSSGED